MSAKKLVQLSFIETSLHEDSLSDWTFSNASTRDLTHCYHDYPARMIPQVAGRLIDLFGARATLLFDPYCGSGTSLVEASIRGIHAVGTDLNPLARLIAKAKVSTPDLDALEHQIMLFNRFALGEKERRRRLPDKFEVHGISNLEFWFKTAVIEKLFEIREFVKSITDENIRLFFQVALSETVRESSNTRSNEFKLYRYSEDKLSQFNPDVYGIMAGKLYRNLQGYRQYKAIIANLREPPSANIYDFNTVEGIPQTLVQDESVDVVVTSPPYGDSGTTVAYGQYSRLSAAWLELEEPHKIDRKLMGARAVSDVVVFPSRALNQAIEQVRQADEKRARHVTSFYSDLRSSISNVAKVVRRGGYVCYVVGNRKVKGVVLPTDIAIKDFFENCGFVHVNTFSRAIPNKRMPSKNSPTNEAGVLDSTMTREYIVVMKRAC
jgi:site-specific DNA-methyltransferase (cytosine-N4-specific)